MNKNKIIIIYCKTDSRQIVRLLYKQFRDFFGKNNVEKILFNVNGDLEERTNLFIKKALESGKYIQIVSGEFLDEDERNSYIPWCNELVRKGIKFAYIFDTEKLEEFYSGRILKELILKKIYEIRDLINCFY